MILDFNLIKEFGNVANRIHKRALLTFAVGHHVEEN